LAIELLEDRCLFSYTITDLGTFGGTISGASDINKQGQVVGGAYLACNCVDHAFLWAGDILHDLGLSGSNGAYGINDLGQVVGHSDHPFLWSKESGFTDLGFIGYGYKVNNRTEVVGQLNSPPHAVLWKDGAIRDLGTINGGVSAAYDVNDQGQVVGQSGGQAFFWTADAGMHDLGTLDGALGGTSGANAINNLGQIVGASYSIAFGTSHATFFSREGAVDLGTLGTFSEALAVNTLGQVVGSSSTSTGNRAFLTDLNGGPMVDLNTLIPPGSGWIRLFTAVGINDAGQIIGTGVLPGYENIHAYLLTPEDSSLAALVTVGRERSEVRPVNVATGFAEYQRSDIALLGYGVEAWRGVTVSEADSRLVSRSVAVLADLAAGGGSGPLGDVLPW
jgi:probable HAF family extracellular repeat protein